MAVDVGGLGTSCVDLNATVTSIPTADENVLTVAYEQHPGGRTNTSCGFGMDVRFFRSDFFTPRILDRYQRTL